MVLGIRYKEGLNTGCYIIFYMDPDQMAIGISFDLNKRNGSFWNTVFYLGISCNLLKVD